MRNLETASWRGLLLESRPGMGCRILEEKISNCVEENILIILLDTNEYSRVNNSIVTFKITNIKFK